MYDTVKIFAETRNSERVLPRLENVVAHTKTHENGLMETYFSGVCRNLTIYANDRGVSVGGSLAKFRFGNNFECLTRGETKRALSELSECLGVDIEAARVSRVDVGANLCLKEPVTAYLQALGTANRYKRSFYDDTLYYKNGLRQLVFYDKAAEMEHRKQALPALFDGANVLRYEFRVMKRVANEFGTNEFLARDLYDENRYIQAVRTWRDSFNAIKTERTMLNTAIFELRDFRQAKNVLAYRQILADYGTLGAALEAVEAARRAGVLNRFQAKRYRDGILELNASEDFTEQNDRVVELTRKVRMQSEFYV